MFRQTSRCRQVRQQVSRFDRGGRTKGRPQAAQYKAESGADIAIRLRQVAGRLG
jgi:hypothetical protein